MTVKQEVNLILYNKIRINFYHFLQQYIYSNDGLLKKYFSGKLNQSDVIGKELFLTSFISFDFHRIIVLITIVASFIFTFIFQGNILIILQSVLAACIFDYISNVMMREYQKNILSYEVAHTLLNIDKRIQSIKLQIGVPEKYSIDHNNLRDIKTIDFTSERATTTILYDKNETKELYVREKKLNRSMTKLEYILFLHVNNIKDINSLLNTKNIEVCPNLYKALLCAYQYSDVIYSNINEFVGGFITDFDRISFWSKMELGIYTPQILNMGTKFRKENISDYIIFGNIVIYHNNSLPESTRKKLNYKSIIKNILIFIEKLLLIMSVFWLIKNSDLPLIEGMPEFMNQLLLKTESYLFSTGIAVGILLICLIKKINSFFHK